MEEHSYWEKLKSGDMQGLQGLYDLHADTLYAYGMLLCKDPERVKDCIQDLFLHFWHSHATLTIPRSGKAYLMVSLRRRIFDSGPRSILTTVSMEETMMSEPSDTLDPETDWIQSESDDLQQEKLMKAMAAISDRQREIIHMKYFQQLDYEDIGRIMGLNYQSARNLVTRALMALRREMLLILWILCMGL